MRDVAGVGVVLLGGVGLDKLLQYNINNHVINIINMRINDYIQIHVFTNVNPCMSMHSR